MVSPENVIRIQWRNEVNCRPGREGEMQPTPTPHKKEKIEQKKTQKAGMH